jgi:poly-beta-1,6-N-acetyl-D-glucosamine synthase
VVTVFLFICGFTIVFTVVILISWRQISAKVVLPISKFTRKVSLIIPLRDEEKNIERLLEDLERQTIQKEIFEVILINDHSGDNTLSIANRAIQELSIDVKIIASEGEGKKAAIETGIAKSSGEIIVTTDGDCRVGPNWLKTLVSYLEEKNAAMICGPVRFIYSAGIWDQGLMMEFAVLQAIGAATLNMRIPTMCNGANLAYLKGAFVEVNGFEGNKHIPSGDDEFLMHKFSRLYPGDVHFLKSQEAIVETKSSSGLEWFNQRKRWASKWKGYEIKSPKLVASAIFLFNLNILFGLLLVIKEDIGVSIYLGAVGLKFFFDYLLIFKANNFFERKSNLLIFIILEFLFPVYVFCFGFLGILGNYTWKGRTSKV